ncbi:leucyl aminopeptidase [Mycena sp. CBHHK59/15]|nr:leucyl aminopeptidase [Mycena sp. CBHHK59/15]
MEFQDKFRLPVNVQPTHYDVTVWTDLQTLKFGGFVKIGLNIHQETSTVVLNSKDLNLGDASIYSDGLQSEQLQSEQTVDKELDRVTFTFPTALPAGSKAQLKVDFNSPLRASMTGYYKSAWEQDGQTKHYALTQFEPTDARAMFPCWDEPLLKATFAITMVSQADTVNLSNMPAISEEVYDPNHQATTDIGKMLSSLPAENKWKITQFQTTPIMSSYIVAIANGPFVHLEKRLLPLSGKTVPLRIYSTPDVIHQADFALDVAARVIPLYETVFDVEFPLPKLDTLVNWGLITGRTNALLLDPAKADINAKKNVAMTQSHEVAHMWFGNITTMRWWDNLYLNEGLYFVIPPFLISCLSSIFPEWRPNSEFISDHLQSALALDAKLSSHPIEVECPDANYINQIFDALSYSKAASVLRMLSDYVGEDKFLKGVSIYLKRNLYGNTVTNDLWDGISTATGINVNRIMDNWITKIGFPVITVTENPNGIHVRQDRFLGTGIAEPGIMRLFGKHSASCGDLSCNGLPLNRSVPLSILSVDPNGQVSIDKTAILEEREKTIALDTSGNFKLNAGTVGVYRVLYTPERLAKMAIEAAKDNTAFSLDDRIGILYDVMALSRAGLSKLSDTLTVIDIWSNEKEYLVWSSISDALGGIVYTFWESPQTVSILRAFMRSLFVPIVKRLGYTYPSDELTDVSLLRTCAISAAMTGKDQGISCVKVSILKSRFTYYMETGNDSRIPANLQGAIFTAAVKYGGRAEYEAVRKIQENPPTPTARITAIYAMGSTQDPALLDETFSYILTKARDQDIIYFFRGLQSSVIARRALPSFFKRNYDFLMKRFEGNFTLQSLVTASFGTLSTEEDYKDVEEFFKDKDIGKYHMALAQTLDTIRARIAYIERSSDDLSEWLDKWEKRSKL